MKGIRAAPIGTHPYGGFMPKQNAKGPKRRPKKRALPNYDARKLLISGEQVRRGSAWPDIEDGVDGSLGVNVQSTEHQRSDGRVDVVIFGAINGAHGKTVEIRGASIAQVAACLVRAASHAIRNGALAELSPESTELLARLEAAVAQGDNYNG